MNTGRSGDHTSQQIITTAKRELERMIDTIPTGMMLVDSEGTVLRINVGLLRLLDRNNFADVLGMSCRELFPMRADGAWILDDVLSATITPDQVNPITREANVIMPDFKTPRVYSFSAIPAGERPQSFVVLVEDITERKEAAKQAEQVLQLQTTTAVVGGLMHNINQPLTVIMASAYLILMEVKNENSDMDKILASTEQIMDMVNKIAALVERAHKLKEFAMESYDAQHHILDLNESP